MRVAKSWLLLAVLATVVVGCSSVTSSTIAFHEESLRDANGSLIYLFREKSMVGYAADWKVYLDGQVVGVLRQNAYMPLHMAAGPHTLRVGDSGPLIVGAIVEAVADNPEAFMVRPGQVYFLRSKGFSVDFLTREEAWPTLQQMKQDR